MSKIEDYFCLEIDGFLMGVLNKEKEEAVFSHIRQATKRVTRDTDYLPSVVSYIERKSERFTKILPINFIK